jgi:hypothetical protein
MTTNPHNLIRTACAYWRLVRRYQHLFPPTRPPQHHAAAIKMLNSRPIARAALIPSWEKLPSGDLVRG